MTNILGHDGENPVLRFQLALNDSDNTLESQILHHFKRMREEWVTKSKPALKLYYSTSTDSLILYKIPGTMYHFVEVCQGIVQSPFAFIK